MDLNATPAANRVQIAFFGACNAGKSSLINAVTGQELSIVSPVRGTTTDPVHKAMELLPLGPVVLIDTPGMDDDKELGALRIGKARQVLGKADAAVLVADGTAGITEADEMLLGLFQERHIPYLIALNKSDLPGRKDLPTGPEYLKVSAKTGAGVHALKEALAKLCKQEGPEQKLVGDLIAPMDFVVLVIPIDAAAPKGRLILPQQQVIRDILDSGAVAITVKDTELRETLQNLGRKPKLVITDSQAFAKASSETPADVGLTSFSILFARYKGQLQQSIDGARVLDTIGDGDSILIAEGCTHHRQCDDIGTVKLPNFIRKYTGKQPDFSFVSGGDFPDDLSAYRLVIHCGGCMLNNREMQSRAARVKSQGIPLTNYGISIAYMQGILERSIEMFPEIT